MELIEKLPIWLRWLLVPVSTVISFAVVSLLTGLVISFQNWVFGIQDGSIVDKISINVIAAYVIGFASIFVGIKFAPTSRKKVALILGGCYVLVIGFLLNNLFQNGEIWDYISVTFNLIGMGVAVYVALEQEQ
jgi:hypothetical protein